MFGEHKARREVRRADRAKKELDFKNKQFEAAAPERERQAAAQQQSAIAEKAKMANQTSETARQAGRQDIRDLFNDPSIQGLDNKQRQAMQYEANRGIQRAHQSANRQLLGEQSQRGIQGQGGVGYAQQRDLQRMAQEAQGGVTRDLDKMNSDLRLKNIAAMFAGGEGRAAQELLNQQLAADELQLMDERKRQRAFEEQASRAFNRI